MATVLLLKALHIVLILFVYYKDVASAQEQNQFVYNGFLEANLHLNGIAKIHPNGLLELTNTSKNQLGRAFFPLPLDFSASSPNTSQSLSLSTTFVFAMVPGLPGHGGHGIAFVISPSAEFNGAIGNQFFGVSNSSSDSSSLNHTLVVELDPTFHPDLKDINAGHVGIDLNSLVSNESAPVTYFAENEGKNKTLELLSGKPMQVWIDYDEVEKLLNVTVAPITIRKPKQPLLSKSIDLSQIFLDSMYVGFSASTGAVASHHYILGWSFSKEGQAQSLDLSNLPSLPKSKQKLDPKILALLVTAIVLLIAICGSAYLIRRKRYEEVREDWEQQYGPQRFSYKNLYKATKGFHEKELLGTGGFGKVYRGVLPSLNMQVAVKKFSHDSAQGMKQFVAEIASMGRLRHRNLVQLLGYCRRRRELLLVYDYMPNGSLDMFLFRNEKPSLDWVQRYQILQGVASGLHYLHEEWEQVVLHRDVKASNVLLDADLHGRLGDFGLAKFHDHGSNPQTTCVVGTVGYVAPELIRTGRPTTSSDVFAFGSLLLECACGRKPFEPQRPPEEAILADWVSECWKRGAIADASDPRLEGNYVVEEMELALKLGLLCTHPTQTARPSMREVVQYLDGHATLPGMQLDSAGAGLVSATPRHEMSAEYSLSSPVSLENSSIYSFSSSDSILSRGR